MHHKKKIMRTDDACFGFVSVVTYLVEVAGETRRHFFSSSSSSCFSSSCWRRRTQQKALTHWSASAHLIGSY